MSEASDHETLKAIGKEILRSKGFADCEIFLEFPVLQAGQILERAVPLLSPHYDQLPIKYTVKKGIIADVVGLKDNHSVVIECGNTPSDRLCQLKLFFDEVLYLPYVKVMGHPEKDILELNSQIATLTSENTKLREDNEHYKRRLDDLETKIREALRR